MRLTAFVTIDVHEHRRIDDLAMLLSRMAEVAGGDEGTEVWDACRVPDRPGRFLVYERYTDAAAVRRHRGDAELATLDATLRTMATISEVVPAVLEAGVGLPRDPSGRSDRG